MAPLHKKSRQQSDENEKNSRDKKLSYIFKNNSFQSNENH